MLMHLKKLLFLGDAWNNLQNDGHLAKKEAYCINITNQINTLRMSKYYIWKHASHRLADEPPWLGVFLCTVFGQVFATYSAFNLHAYSVKHKSPLKYQDSNGSVDNKITG